MDETIIDQSLFLTELWITETPFPKKQRFNTKNILMEFVKSNLNSHIHEYTWGAKKNYTNSFATLFSKLKVVVSPQLFGLQRLESVIICLCFSFDSYMEKEKQETHVNPHDSCVYKSWEVVIPLMLIWFGVLHKPCCKGKP